MAHADDERVAQTILCHHACCSSAQQRVTRLPATSALVQLPHCMVAPTPLPRSPV